MKKWNAVSWYALITGIATALWVVTGLERFAGAAFALMFCGLIEYIKENLK